MNKTQISAEEYNNILEERSKELEKILNEDDIDIYLNGQTKWDVYELWITFREDPKKEKTVMDALERLNLAITGRQREWDNEDSEEYNIVLFVELRDFFAWP